MTAGGSRRVGRNRALTVLAVLVGLVGGLVQMVPATASSGQTALSTEAPAPEEVATEDVTAGGNYHPLRQAVLADTRSGVGVPAAKLVAGAAVDVQITGRGGVPATGVAAVSLQLTSVNSSAETHVGVYPTGSAPTAATTLITMPSETLSNIAFIGIGSGGKVRVTLGAGSSDLVVYVNGYFTHDETGHGFSTVTQSRVADTRYGTGVPTAAQIPAGGTVTVSLPQAQVPDDAVAVAVNVAVISTANGYFTVGVPGELTSAGTSGNFSPGTNAVAKVVPISTAQTMQIRNDAATPIHVIIDLQGYFGSPDGGGGFHVALERIHDTRQGGGPMAYNEVRTFHVLGQGDMPTSGVGAVSLTLTVVNPTSIGYLRVWADGEPEPTGVSTLNYQTGQNQSNSVMVTTAAPATGRIKVRNVGSGTPNLVIDGQGWFDPYVQPDPGDGEPEGMTEVPIPHVVGISEAVGTVEPYPVPTLTPVVHASAVDEGREAYLAGEDLGGGPPASERPVLRFEVEVWTDGENSTLLDTLQLTTQRPEADYPTLSFGQAAVSDGVVGDGDRVKVRARTSWAAAPDGVDPTSDWTDWQSYVIKLPPPTPTNVLPAEGAQITDPRPNFEAEVPASSSEVTGTFEILDANGWRVEMGTSGPASGGQLRWRPSEPLVSGTYSWRVTASNPSGASVWSEPTGFTMAVPPSPPEGVTAEGLTRQAKISWQLAPPDSNVTGYVVKALPDGPTVSVPRWSPYTYINLAGDREWSFSVQAENEHGLSDAVLAGPVFVNTAAPGAPWGFYADTETSTAELGWRAPTDDGGRPVTGYQLSYRRYGTADVIGQFTTTDTSATVTDLVPGTRYRFEVRTVNSIGLSAPSIYDTWTITTPSAPTEVIVRPADGALDVHWERPEDDGRDWVSSYTVAVSPGDRRVTVDSSDSDVGVRVDGLDNGTAYTVTVVATNRAGDGPGSAPVGPISPISSSEDTDADGLPDVMEFRAGSNHLVPDTDDDGLDDRYEALELAGLSSPIQADTDGDGVSDLDADVDGDGLTNTQEAGLGTDPAAADTDLDQLADGAEVSAQTDPLAVDSDGDTVPDGIETQTGLDPLQVDSDGDGLPDDADAAERAASSEPDPFMEMVPASVTVTATGTPVAIHRLRVQSSGVATAPSAFTPTAVVTVPEDENGETPAVTLEDLSLPLLTQHLPAEVGVLSSGPSGWSLADNEVVITPGAGSVVVDSAEVGVRYAVVDLADWRARLRGCDLLRAGEGARLDIELVLDETQSVAGADPSGERFDAARAVLNTLSPGDAVDVRAFGWVWWSTGFGGAVVAEPDLERPGPDGYVSVATALEIVDQLQAHRPDYSFLDDYDWDATEPWKKEEFLSRREHDDRTDEQKQCRQKAVILVTDAADQPHEPDDEYPHPDGYIPFAERTDPPVHVLDVGSGATSAQWLIDIAARTGGTYSHVPTLDIAPAPDWDRNTTPPEQAPLEGIGQDLDQDGLDDWIEREGVDVALASSDGPVYKRIRTNPTQADSDQDGLLDGEEMGRQFTAAELGGWASDTPITVFHTVSVALSSDGDGDGLLDTEELELGLDPLSWDVDTDMVSDGDEALWGTSPERGDTDGDQRSDWVEIEFADEGLDPTVFNERVSETKFLEDAATGFICGEFEGCQVYSIGWLVGNIASGVLIFGDIRDIIAHAQQGDEFEAALSGVGLVPYLGDAAKAMVKIIKVLPHLKQADQATAIQMTRRFTDDASEFADALRQIDPNLVDNLRGLGVGDDALRSLLAKNSLEHLRRIVDSPRRVNFDYPPGLRPGPLPGGRFNGHVAEETTQRLLGLPDSALKKACRRAPTNCRFVDVSEVTPLGATILHEAKTGFVTGKLAMSQIAKDRFLKGDQNTTVAWHFYASVSTGRIGPSETVLKALEDAGIPFYIHFPG